MSKQHYQSGQKVILVVETQGLKEGKELTISSHYKDDEYNCFYFENKLKHFDNFFEDEFRLKTKYDKDIENDESSD